MRLAGLRHFSELSRLRLLDKPPQSLEELLLGLRRRGDSNRGGHRVV